MKPHNRPFFAARLLSGKEMLTVQEKETVLKKVLDRVDAKPGKVGGLRHRAPVGAVGVGVGIVLLTMVVSFVFLSTLTPDEKDAITVKGAEDAFFNVKCISEGGTGRCAQQGKLVFQLRPPENRRYFAALSKHRKTGVVVWYFPESEDAIGVDIESNTTNDILSQGIELGPEHVLGEWDVYGVFCRGPMKREQIRDVFDQGEGARVGKSDCYISKRQLTIF